MAEYIELTDLWSSPFDYIIDTCGSSVAQGFVDRVNEIEPADVRPVVRGRWIPKNADGSWRVDTCSACKKNTHYVRYAPAYDYCPNCGADMRETKK